MSIKVADLNTRPAPIVKEHSDKCCGQFINILMDVD